VQICNVGGITGWTLPGSDTCVKLSGYITAQFTGGNLSTQYNWGSLSQLTNPASLGGLPLTGVPNFPGTHIPISNNPLTGQAWTDTQQTQRVLIAGSPAQHNTTFFRDETGWSIRANFGMDLASNTAYGPLIGHFDVNVDASNGFDALQGAPYSPLAYLNTGYLTWAGITAGKAASFFSFTGGGDNFANFFSPDRKGFNEPYLIAYTASFGGGFSATISAESNQYEGASGSGSNMGGPTITTVGGEGTTSVVPISFGGERWPDIVGNIHVKQGWGEAQVSGVLHNVNVFDNNYYFGNGSTFGQGLNALNGNAGNLIGCGLSGLVPCNSQKTQTGWAVDAGVKFNIQNWWGIFGTGDTFLVTGEYGQSATWYSGLTGEGMWGEWGQVNGNGQPLFLPDAYFNPFTNTWSRPTSWSVSALLEHHFTPQFYIDLEGSIGGFSWSNVGGGGCNFYGLGCGAITAVNNAFNGAISPHDFSWLIGADIGWNPVTNLNFDLELMYENSNQSKPNGFAGTIYNWGMTNPNGSSAAFFVPGDWKGTSSGFAGRLRITRHF
jgi:hypothetical protein